MIKNTLATIILLTLALHSFPFQKKNTNNYHFDGKICEEVLRNYLSRSVTMAEFCVTQDSKIDGKDNALEDDIRLIRNTGAKFIGRSLFRWGGEQILNDPRFLTHANTVINRVHNFDQDVIFQAAVFGIVSKQVETIAIPASVFEAFGLTAEPRTFCYEKMLYRSGQFVNHWGAGSSAPDITQTETKLWLFFLATSYIDAGFEAIHWGQVDLMGKNDSNLKHWFELLAMIRNYSKENARRHFVLNDAHTPNGGFMNEGVHLMDFNSFPLRIVPKEGEFMEGELPEKRHQNSIYNRSKGGLTSSGWECKGLPYIVEFDNFGISSDPGNPVKGAFIWGYDEITWFSLKSIEDQKFWLEYAYNWVKEKDPNGYLQVPVSRNVVDGENPVHKYKANIKSKYCPTGTGLEEEIKEIWYSEQGLSWEELSRRYELPKWFRNARFGVWVHWGAQTLPDYGGGWYARHMYQKEVGNEIWGKSAYEYHIKTYGHPSEVGFKDVINQWKAENLDTDKLLDYFTNELGARYFMALANHHDHFDNFNSTYHKWNSVNIGPKRDIIKEFSESAKKFNVPFGVSIHDERHLEWWLTAFGADKSGALKGVPYDGHLTKEDGVGTWWEGLDPANLYGLPPEKRTDEWVEEVKYNWMLRHKELLTRYDIDFIWFDGWGFPYGEYGKETLRTFLNHNLKKHGKINAVIAGKIPGEKIVLKDIERGVPHELLEDPWQSISTFHDWFYKRDKESRHNTRSIIELLIDVISKNGNYMLNIELLPDGTIPYEHKSILDEFGKWVKLNSEAIYDSKPWSIFGDNLNSHLKKLGAENADVTDLSALKKEEDLQFNNRDRNSIPYGHDEVRFTTKNGNLYMFVLNPGKGKIHVPSLGLKSDYKPKRIKSIELIGSELEIDFNQSNEELTIGIPEIRPNEYSVVFRIN
jgi:alpha-L-fucosidase